MRQHLKSLRKNRPNGLVIHTLELRPIRASLMFSGLQRPFVVALPFWGCLIAVAWAHFLTTSC